MNIYTSYFGNYKNFPKNAIPIGITRFPPEGILNIKMCAPSEDLLKKYKDKQIDEFIFSIKFKEELIERFQTPEKLLDLLMLISGGLDVVLCCYEKTGEFCHRQVLCDWLNMGTEI